jgi:hypothetical protein
VSTLKKITPKRKKPEPGRDCQTGMNIEAGEEEVKELPAKR